MFRLVMTSWCHRSNWSDWEEKRRKADKEPTVIDVAVVNKHLMKSEAV